MRMWFKAADGYTCKTRNDPHWEINRINSLRTSNADVLLSYAIIGSDNVLSPDRRQAIMWTNAEILLNGSWKQVSKKLSSKWTIFIQEMYFLNVVWKIALFVSASMCWRKSLFALEDPLSFLASIA